MAIIYRAVKGRELTNAEVDANFSQLANGSVEGFKQSGTDVERSWIDKARDVFSRADFASKAEHDAEAASRFTVNIPTDYATLQLAVDTLSSTVVGNGVDITLLIESGHALTTGLLIEDGDYGRFTISSADATVSLAVGFVYVDATYRAVMKAVHARAPVWNIKVDCGGQAKRALYYDECSSGVVESGKGAINATFGDADDGAGLYANGGSRVHAPGAVFTGNSRGAWITRGSVANLDGSALDDAENNGLYVAAGSSVSFIDGTATDCTNNGINANDSRIQAIRADVSGAGSRGFLAENTGSVDATDGIAQNCTLAGVSAEGVSNINARSVDASGSGTGFRVTLGGHVDMTGGTGTTSQAVNLWRREGVITDNDEPNIVVVTSSSLELTAYTRQRSGASLSIADDGVATLDLKLSGSEEWGIIEIASATVGDGSPNGIFRYRVGASPNITIVSFERTTNIAATTGALTGTTGSDGNFTISAHTDGLIYFENRTGATVRIRVRAAG